MPMEKLHASLAGPETGLHKPYEEVVDQFK